MSRPPSAAEPPPVTPWRWWTLAFALWLLLLAAASLTLWHLRREALEAQTRELALLSLALTDEIDRGLRGAEEGLHALRGELQDARLPLNGGAASAPLRTRADLMPLVATLWITDAQGRLLAASNPGAPPPLSIFGTQLDRLPADRIAFGAPFTDARSGHAFVALALRFAAAQGGGWIVAGVPASTLLGAFAIAAPAADAGMAVFGADGTRLVGSASAAATLEELRTGEPLRQRAHTMLLRLDGDRARIATVHTLPRYQLQVIVTRDVDAMLQAWRQTAEAAAIALLLLLAILAAAVHFALLAARRRADARRAMQSQLARASRLEALGTLAGGVAHDFNNVLAAIVGYGEMARDQAPADSAQARHLDRVLQAALRGKGLVERITGFSRGGARASTVFELEPVVEEVLALLSASLRPGVVLERVLQAPGARLRGDPTRAFEAVMNLCTNAMQAMPQGGMLTVGLRRLQVPARRVLSHSSLEAGRYLALTVADQGGGITAEVAEHLFEPFFTTRAAQSGTGLGLAVVHGVVAEFGGGIDVQSQPGQGARFTLYLPESEDATAAAGPVAPPAAAGAGQRILVVDDQPELVAMTEELLQGLGYQAAGHTDPAAALATLREEPGGFAALITDEVMPGLSGTQLARAARELAPGMPVLLVSGYGGVSLAQRAADAGVNRVLPKPLQRAELARVLGEMLH